MGRITTVEGYVSPQLIRKEKKPQSDISDYMGNRLYLAVKRNSTSFSVRVCFLFIVLRTKEIPEPASRYIASNCIKDLFSENNEEVGSINSSESLMHREGLGMIEIFFESTIYQKSFLSEFAFILVELAAHGEKASYTRLWNFYMPLIKSINRGLSEKKIGPLERKKRERLIPLFQSILSSFVRKALPEKPIPPRVREKPRICQPKCTYTNCGFINEFLSSRTELEYSSSLTTLAKRHIESVLPEKTRQESALEVSIIEEGVSEIHPCYEIKIKKMGPPAPEYDEQVRKYDQRCHDVKMIIGNLIGGCYYMVGGKELFSDLCERLEPVPASSIKFPEVPNSASSIEAQPRTKKRKLV